MTEKQVNDFMVRIDQLRVHNKPSFGKMNANQMICHCADLFRMAKGTKSAIEYGRVSPNEIKSLAREGRTIPAPIGFGQVEGDGTKPTNFANDKRILKEYLQDFSTLPDDYDFATHPYFGKMDRQRWVGLAVHHLNHHLGQFNV